MFSIFNNIAENAMDGNALLPPPMLRLPTPDQEQKLAEYSLQITNSDAKLRKAIAELNYVDPAAITNSPAPQPTSWSGLTMTFPPMPSLKSGMATNPTSG